MKQARTFIEAVLIVTALVTGMIIILGLTQPLPVKQSTWQPYRPVEVSPPMDTSLYTEWEDNFDTSFTDEDGVYHVTRKEYVEKTR